MLVSGKDVEIMKTHIHSCNELLVEAGTTGHMGGDSGHGGRTYFKIQNDGATDIKVGFTDNPKCFSTDGFYVELGGDCELDTMIAALSYIIKVLVCQSKKSDIASVEKITITESGINIKFKESKFDWLCDNKGGISHVDNT